MPFSDKSEGALVTACALLNFIVVFGLGKKGVTKRCVTILKTESFWIAYRTVWVYPRFLLRYRLSRYRLLRMSIRRVYDVFWSIDTSHLLWARIKRNKHGNQLLAFIFIKKSIPAGLPAGQVLKSSKIYPPFFWKRIFLKRCFIWWYYFEFT